eukprot:5253712-Amphidinium_carterae.1
MSLQLEFGVRPTTPWHCPSSQSLSPFMCLSLPSQEGCGWISPSHIRLSCIVPGMLRRTCSTWARWHSGSKTNPSMQTIPD